MVCLCPLLVLALPAPSQACTTVSSSWYNSSFTAQTGTFTATVAATPSGSPINSVIGLSDGSQSAYTELAAIARFNPSGNIDAYNGSSGAYEAASTIPYKAGTSYLFEYDVNVATQTYTVYVTPGGGTKTLVGAGFAFRLSASTLDSLAAYAETGSSSVCNFSVSGGSGSSSTTCAHGSGSLNPAQPPGCNFNLSVWQIQLPTGTTGDPTTISNPELATYTDSHFYTATDGAMHFDDPGVNCVTTPNSLHCRSELSEVRASDPTSTYNWSPTGTNTLSARLKVTNPAGEPVIGQIHLNASVSVRPLVELYYNFNGTGHIEAGVEQCLAGGCEDFTDFGPDPSGEFSYVISYGNGGQLTISINGGTPKSLGSPILGNQGYFKAGDYGQAATDAAVSFYALTIVHNP